MQRANEGKMTSPGDSPETAPVPVATSPEALSEEMVEQARRRAVISLSPRERAGELGASLGFIAAAAVFIAVGSPLHSFDLPLAVILVIAYALTSRIKFEIGAGYVPPTQLVLVPMLFLAPLTAVPVMVAIGHLLGEMPEYLRRRRHPERAVYALGDSWYAFGPAAVLSAAGVADPVLSEWPWLLAALGAQFAVDLFTTSVREWFELGVAPSRQLEEMRLIWTVDSVVSPIGFLAVASGYAYAWLMTLPLVLLLHMLGRERAVRFSKAVELRTAYEGTSLLLGDLIESDDPYTGAHSRSVVLLCLRIADRLQLEAHQRQVTEYAALLHDVGKISIPGEIINKPGPLDDTEWEEMKQHTIEGEKMLAPIGGVMQSVSSVVRSSHERWDGRGYPDGLEAERIPVEARIVAVCDAFNAMTTDRSYRRALAEEEALEELRRNAGTQFDPNIVEAFLDLHGEAKQGAEIEVTARPEGSHSLKDRGRREHAGTTA